jgi:hypothetical protein
MGERKEQMENTNRRCSPTALGFLISCWIRTGHSPLRQDIWSSTAGTPAREGTKAPTAIKNSRRPRAAEKPVVLIGVTV